MVTPCRGFFTTRSPPGAARASRRSTPRPTRAAGPPSCGPPSIAELGAEPAGQLEVDRAVVDGVHAALDRADAQPCGGSPRAGRSRIAGGHGALTRSTRSATAQVRRHAQVQPRDVSTTSPPSRPGAVDPERELARPAAVARVLGDHRAGRADADRVARARRSAAGPPPPRGCRSSSRPRPTRAPSAASADASTPTTEAPIASSPLPSCTPSPAQPLPRRSPPRRTATPAASASRSLPRAEPCAGTAPRSPASGNSQPVACRNVLPMRPVGADLQRPGLEADAAARADLALVGAHDRDRAVGPPWRPAPPRRSPSRTRQHRERAAAAAAAVGHRARARARPPRASDARQTSPPTMQIPVRTARATSAAHARQPRRRAGGGQHGRHHGEHARRTRASPGRRRDVGRVGETPLAIGGRAENSPPANVNCGWVGERGSHPRRLGRIVSA